MQRTGLLNPARVIEFLELEMRGQSDHMPDIHYIRRHSRHEIHAIHRETLFAIEVHEVRVEVEEKRHSERRRVGQDVPHLGKALKGIWAAGIQRLQILPEKIGAPIRQPLRGQQRRFTAGRCPLRA